MIHSKINLLLSITMAFNCTIFCQQNLDTDTTIYELMAPSKKNYDASPRIVNWQEGKKIHFIKFGEFTTETTWEIFDKMEYDTRWSESPQPIIKLHFNAQTNVMIDITKLKKGKYYINFTAIAAGCKFEMHIN